MTIKFEDIKTFNPMRGLNTFLEDKSLLKNVSYANKMIARHDIMVEFIMENKESFSEFLGEFIEWQTEEENLLVVDEAVQYKTEIEYHINSERTLGHLLNNFRNKIGD